MIKKRWALPQEREKIQRYLHENMGKIDFERWANILDCRWNKIDEKYGVVVEKDGELAGFLGIVFADRILDGKMQRTGNITSWFLEKNLRRSGLGQEMLELITLQPGVIYTATSANFRSGALLKKIGWELLEDTRLYWHRKSRSTKKDCLITSGHNDLREILDPKSAKILQDHAGLNLTPHLLTCTGEPDLFFVTYTKIKGQANTAHCEILYANDVALLSQNIRKIAQDLLEQDNCVLSSDKRFLIPDVTYDDRDSLKVKRYFKPCNNLPANLVDFLYGEVVLLDLKIY